LPALNGNGAAPTVPIAVPVEPSQAILPPRPTGRTVAAQKPSPSLWGSWPIIVIIIALLAIGVAVALLVWPRSHDEGKHGLVPPPAPERMETNPLPPPPSPPASSDPSSGPHSQVVPRPTPDPVPPPPQQIQPDDDLNGPDPTPFGPGPIPHVDFLYTAIGKYCDKLKACPGADQDELSSACDMVSALPKQPAPACPAAKRCLEHIEHLTCSQAIAGNPMSTVMIFQDCAAAMSC
jgi:hypothetical protein